MNINSFYSYNLNERMKLVNQYGEYLSRISYYGYFISLYCYEGTLIEVYYNRYSNTIAEIEVLDQKDECLNRYTAQVNLSDLYTKKP